MTDAAADQSTDPLAGTNPEMNEAATASVMAPRLVATGMSTVPVRAAGEHSAYITLHCSVLYYLLCLIVGLFAYFM